MAIQTFNLPDPGEGLDEGLGRLDLEHHVVDLDGVPRCNLPLHDLGLDEALSLSLIHI